MIIGAWVELSGDDSRRSACCRYAFIPPSEATFFQNPLGTGDTMSLFFVCLELGSLVAAFAGKHGFPSNVTELCQKPFVSCIFMDAFLAPTQPKSGLQRTMQNCQILHHCVPQTALVGTQNARPPGKKGARRQLHDILWLDHDIPLQLITFDATFTSKLDHHRMHFDHNGANHLPPLF